MMPMRRTSQASPYQCPHGQRNSVRPVRMMRGTFRSCTRCWSRSTAPQRRRCSTRTTAPRRGSDSHRSTHASGAPKTRPTSLTVLRPSLGLSQSPLHRAAGSAGSAGRHADRRVRALTHRALCPAAHRPRTAGPPPACAAAGTAVSGCTHRCRVQRGVRGPAAAATTVAAVTVAAPSHRDAHHAADVCGRQSGRHSAPGQTVARRSMWERRCADQSTRGHDGRGTPRSRACGRRIGQTVGSLISRRATRHTNSHESRPHRTGAAAASGPVAVARRPTARQEHWRTRDRAHRADDANTAAVDRPARSTGHARTDDRDTRRATGADGQRGVARRR